MNLRMRYEKMIELISNISPYIGVEKFMEELIRITVSVMEPIRGGCVFIPSGKDWICSVVYRMDDSMLGLKFNEDEIFIPPGNEPIIFKAVPDLFKKPRYDVVKILERSRFLMETKPLVGVSIRMEESEKPLAVFFFELEENRTMDHFTFESLKAFGKIALSFLIIKIYERKEREHQINMIKAMIRLIELRDPYTKGHGERVGRLATMLARRLKLPEEFITRVYWAGLLHDIGKLGVPEAILNKPGKLTGEEYEIVKKHPIFGEKALEDFENLQDIRPMIRHHHERWDGNGYPDGLKGEEIPLGSRIIAVVDVFDALTSDRPYRKALDVDKAIGMIKREMEGYFDPNIARKFLRMFEELEYPLLHRKSPHHEG